MSGRNKKEQDRFAKQCIYSNKRKEIIQGNSMARDMYIQNLVGFCYEEEDINRKIIEFDKKQSIEIERELKSLAKKIGI